jgi:CRP-like cAMP-binding protein
MQEKVDTDALRKLIEQFVTVTDSDWFQLLPHLSIKQLKKVDYFAKEGKKAHYVGLLLQGSMRQYYTKDGEERTTYFFLENQLVCDYVSCVQKARSLLNIEALTHCELITFRYSVIEELYNVSQTWQTFGRRIAEYLTIGLEERMVSLLLLSPEERYLQMLNSNKRRLLEEVPQQYLANYLGITPVSLSRIRKRLTTKK